MDNDCLDANCCPSCKEPMNHNSRGWGCNNKDCENRYTFWVGPYFVNFNGEDRMKILKCWLCGQAIIASKEEKDFWKKMGAYMCEECQLKEYGKIIHKEVKEDE